MKQLHYTMVRSIFITIAITMTGEAITDERGKEHNCQHSCAVLEKRSNTNANCKFPFIYKETSYKGCTNADDENGKYWCSTMVNKQGIHVGGHGYWGFCENWSYDTECNIGKSMIELQDYLDQELGIKDHCTETKFKTKDVINFLGRSECQCKPITECHWILKLRKFSDVLPHRNKLRQKVVDLIKKSICNKSEKTVYCCDETLVIRKLHVHKERLSGQWKPQAIKGECGQDLSETRRRGKIFCDDEEHDCVAKRKEFPFMALLGYDSFGDNKIHYTCGASVINKKYVLTAAHCHNENIARDKIREVIIGEYIVGKGPDCEGGSCSPPIQMFGVEKVTVHEQWDYGEKGFLKGNDIAIVRLDGIITLFDEDPVNSVVMPICLPWNIDDPRSGSLKEGSKLSIIGWGKSSESDIKNQESYLKNSVASRILRKVKIPITTPESPAYENCKSIDTKLQFCAGGIKGFDSCSGDSGGPASYRKTHNSPMFQLGIISYGYQQCGKKDRPGRYTLVEAFLPWIRDNLEP